MEGEQRTLVEGVLQNEDDEVLLLQRSDHESCAGQWQPPAGKIEYLEPPTAALAREFYEETGLYVAPKPEPDGLLNVTDYPLNEDNAADEDDEGRHSIMISYEVEAIAPYDPDDVELSDEHQAYDWVEPEKALESPEYDVVDTFNETLELLR